MQIKNKIFFVITSLLLLTHLPAFSKTWLQEEAADKREILSAFWNNRIVNYNQASIDNFKSAIINRQFPKDPLFESKINSLFQDAVQQKINFELFYKSLKDESAALIEEMNQVEKLIPEKSYQEIADPIITQADLIAIQRYIKNKKLSVSITFGTPQSGLITPNYPENQYQYPFAIHSVGKILTGTLVLMMVEQGVISEDDLNRPVQLDKTVLKQLPNAVREQLKNVTLHQLMTHRGGLGDYLGNYCKAIESGHVPVIQHAEDFLPFVDNNIYPIGVERYSNAGLLLVGLAIKHAYETKFRHPINYDVLLHNMLVEPIGMTSFSILKPANAKYNLQDPIAPFIAGSPAGGYWLTSADLAKLGQWIYLRAKYDSKFNSLLKKYGQEFYHADDDTVAHGGGIASSSAFLSVSLKTGAVLAIESNLPPGSADDLKMMIQNHVFATLSS